MPDDDSLLYGLLPGFVRYRDQVEGGAFRTVMDALEQQYARLHSEIGRLYEQWFIETCEPWAIPFIGDLVGVAGLGDQPEHIPSLRRLVANIVALRARKGTLTALERAAADATGWPCYAIAGTAQVAQTARLGLAPQTSTLNLRSARWQAWLDAPFDGKGQSIDLRGCDGWADLPAPPLYRDGRRAEAAPTSITLYFWRLGAYPVYRAAPCAVGPGRYTFDPFGADRPLFHLPGTPASAFYHSSPRLLPVALAPSALRDWLRHGGLGRLANEPPQEARFDAENELAVWIDDRPVPYRDMIVADLGSWEAVWDKVGGDEASRRPRLAIDPARGRFALSDDVPVARLRVSYVYALAADIGGGPYMRPPSADTEAVAPWRAVVSETAPSPGGEGALAVDSAVATLNEALRGWASSTNGGIIEFADNGTYAADLELVLAPAAEGAAGDEIHRLVLRASDGATPCLRGTLTVVGGDVPFELELDGIWLDGRLSLSGNLRVRLRHCTVWCGNSDPAMVVADAGGATEQIAVEHSIVGGLSLPSGTTLTLADSLVCGTIADPGGGGGPRLSVLRSTIFEATRATTLQATDALFGERVTVAEVRSGGLDHCYVPPESRTPERHHCEPDRSLEASGGMREDAILRTRPIFTSRLFGAPGIGQLAAATPKAIRTGATDGGEIGVFNGLSTPRRTAALEAALLEFLPWGSQAQVVFAT